MSLKRAFLAGSSLRRETGTLDLHGFRRVDHGMIQQNQPPATQDVDGGGKSAAVDVSRGTVSLQLAVWELRL
ncbi:hypothetical protein ACIQC5_19540 [Paenarthrobacter sp. NPDC092416]|uniref:hypothetical protein n=1 Tax=Paenarthrobacter sp. NPDC092416 TaxID=3364386 RepID=UPI0037FFF3A7